MKKIFKILWEWYLKLHTKKIFKILLVIGLVFSFSGCTYEGEETYDSEKAEQQRLELAMCIDNKINEEVFKNKKKEKELKLNEITNNEAEVKFSHGKIFDKDNMYILVLSSNVYIKDINTYFSKKYSEFQHFYYGGDINVYAHTKDNKINFNQILGECSEGFLDGLEGDMIPEELVDELISTNKIVVKNTKEKEYGVIKNKDSINDILKLAADSKIYGTHFLTDNYSLKLEMYDNDKLINTIYLWKDGKRLKLNGGIDGYYKITNYSIDIREIIEKETDYIFYGISFNKEMNEVIKELVYSDSEYNYYIHFNNSNNFLIEFNTTNKVMTLKHALEKKYITPDQLIIDDLILTKEKKENLNSEDNER